MLEGKEAFRGLKRKEERKEMKSKGKKYPGFNT